MSEKATNILGYLTLFAILGAIWVMFGEDPTREQGARGERTFAALEARVNEVKTLSIAQGDKTVTIVRSGEHWRLQERGGYLVDGDKVRAVLRGAALSKRREPKTSNPERYGRLGLGAEALKIEMRDDTDGLILTFDMGKRKDTADGRSLTYVVQERDTRSWLVSGLAETSVEAGWWLQRPVIEIDNARFSDMTIGGVWLTRKMGADTFKIQGIRRNEQARSDWVLSAPARAVSSLNFDDVRKLNNPLAERDSLIEFTTYDGLSLKVFLYKMDDGTWAQVQAEFDAELQTTGAAGELPAAPVDGAAEAQAITAKVRGWLFKLTRADAEVLSRQRTDFIENIAAG